MFILYTTFINLTMNINQVLLFPTFIRSPRIFSSAGDKRGGRVYISKPAAIPQMILPSINGFLYATAPLKIFTVPSPDYFQKIHFTQLCQLVTYFAKCFSFRRTGKLSNYTHMEIVKIPQMGTLAHQVPPPLNYMYKKQIAKRQKSGFISPQDVL